MSSGGTKSVLHGDDLDNINCLFRGSKELLFIDPKRFGKKVYDDCIAFFIEFVVESLSSFFKRYRKYYIYHFRLSV